MGKNQGSNIKQLKRPRAEPPTGRPPDDKMLANFFSERSGRAYTKRKRQQGKPKKEGKKLESLQEQRLLLEESKNKKREDDACEGIPLLEATRKHQ